MKAAPILTEIKALNPREKLYKVFDGKGPYLEVRPSGGKVWLARHFEKGRIIVKTFGPWPSVTLKTASMLNERKA